MPMREVAPEPTKVTLDLKAQNSPTPVLVAGEMETFFETPEQLKAHAAVVRFPQKASVSLWVSYRSAELL
jgi:hypothetical protein